MCHRLKTNGERGRARGGRGERGKGRQRDGERETERERQRERDRERERRGGEEDGTKKQRARGLHHHSNTEWHCHIFPASSTVKIPMCALPSHLPPSLPPFLPPPSLPLPLCPITRQSFSIKQINWLDILISVVFDLVEYITDVYIAESR